VSQAPPLRVAKAPSFHGGPTIGGPASAAPRQPTSETDAFMLKPSRRGTKAVKTQRKQGQQSQKQPRTKLSAAMMLTVLVLVLAGLAAAIFYLHGIHGPGHF
jgi:hypothetical protein